MTHTVTLTPTTPTPFGTVWDTPVGCGEHSGATFLEDTTGHLYCSVGGDQCATWSDLQTDPGSTVVVHPANRVLYVVPSDTLFPVTRDAFGVAYSRAYRALQHRDALTHPLQASLARGDWSYVTADGASGYVVTASGDLRYVFSTVPGRGDALVSSAVQNGARTLDCFDGYLVTLYARHGFRVTSRSANWSAGGPDVVDMVRG